MDKNIQKAQSAITRFGIIDRVRQCNSTLCAFYNICPHDKTQKCGFIEEYMVVIAGALFEMVEETKDAYLNQSIALKLLPLYQQLAMLRIEELSPNYQIIYKDKMDALRSNPVLKETRETVREIDRLEKELGVSSAMKNKREQLDFDNMMKYGDKDQLELMSE